MNFSTVSITAYDFSSIPGKHLIPSFIKNFTKHVKSNLSAFGMLIATCPGWGDNIFQLPNIELCVSSVAKILLGVRLIVFVAPKPEFKDF